ncbi:MAG: dihydroorotase [Desulfovibrio sp.]|nr:dihydroorotase [Desulfovibrio sp.]
MMHDGTHGERGPYPERPCAAGGERNALFLERALICPGIPGMDGGERDVSARDGKIVDCAPAGELEPPPDAERIACAGKRLFPSFLDVHTHLRDPGHEYKEDIGSGLAAAARGGFGAVMAMANTVPVNDRAAVTAYMTEKAGRLHPHGPRLYPVGALTVGLAGKELARMGELADAGCVAFSNDGKGIADTEIFRRGMEYAAQWGRIVIDHCEDPAPARDALMNEGAVSGRAGIPGVPTVAEALHVARDILLSEYLDLPVHLAHISCRQSVELLRFAADRGLRVSAETCPHYLLLDDSLLEGFNTAAKVNPPLRSREDVRAVREAVRDGLIGVFATDHAPHAAHEKEQPLDQAPCGMIGLETALPLTYTLVRDGLLSEAAFTRMWHSAPAAVFGIPVNNFAPGDPADFFLFDPDEEWTVCRAAIHSKSLNTPFLGRSLRGRVTAHWLGGRRIV